MSNSAKTQHVATSVSSVTVCVGAAPSTVQMAPRGFTQRLRTRGEQRRFNRSLRMAVRGFLGKSRALGVAVGMAAGISVVAATAASAQYVAGGGTAPVNTVNQNILDRLAGTGTLNYPNTASPNSTPQGVVIGASTAYGGGEAIGFNNIAGTSGSFAGFAFGNENLASGAWAVGIGNGNSATATAATAIGVANVASGNTSIAMGRQSTASGNFSIAEGNVAQATAVNAIALGNSVKASAAGAIAIGGGTSTGSSNADSTASQANGVNSIALGTSAVASIAQDIAIGNAAKASGGSSIAQGDNAAAYNANAIAIGHNAVAGVAGGSGILNQTAVGNSAAATGDSASAFGNGATASGRYSTAIGLNASATGGTSTAVGVNASASSVNSLAIGILAHANGSSSGTAVGDSASADAVYSTALGVSSVAGANFATAVGVNARATGLGSFAAGGDSGSTGAQAKGANDIAIGGQSVASGGNAFAGGFKSAASGASGVALGDSALASNTNATALGKSASALGANATAVGTSTVASGADSIAFGSATVAAGANSIAGGLNATTNNLNDIALGRGSVAGVSGGVGSNDTAIGNSAKATGSYSTAVGPTATASGLSSMALGDASSATAAYALATGYKASASGLNATAVGSNTVASGESSVAVGDTAKATGKYAVAIGFGQVAQGQGAVAIGDPSTVIGTGAVGIGAGNTATGNGAIAGGENNTANGLGAIAMGEKNTATGQGAVALGNANTATGQGAIAIGSTSAAKAIGSIALGDTAVANNKNDVALGSGSVTAAPHAGTTALYGGTAAGTAASVVSVGSAGAERQITNVAPGVISAGSTDAINGSQLFSVQTGVDALGKSAASAFGGTAKYDPLTGKISAPVYGVAGTNYGDVGSAIAALANGGASAKYFHANSTLPDSKATGVDSVAIGPNAVATNKNDVALGAGSTTAAPNAGAFTLNGGTATAIAPTSVVSIGAKGSERQLQNVAAGVISATSTDAVNGSQLFIVGTAVNNLAAGTVAAFGGGAKVAADGTVTAPSYVIGGNSYGDVGSALAAQGKLAVQYTPDAKGNPTAVVDLASNAALPAGTKAVALNGVANATTASGAVALGQMPMQYSTAGAPTTANPAVPSNNVTLVGAAAGPVVLANVAPGSLAVGSTQAVNGGQMNTIGTSIATNFGGGATFDPVSGKVTAPSYAIGGTAYNNVGSALTALDASVNGGAGIKYFHTNSKLADSSAIGTDATAIGPNAVAAGNGAIASGSGAQASGNLASAYGFGANASGNGSLALGNGAKAVNANDVALGSGSASGGVHVGVYTLNGGTASAVAATSVVSVGGAGAERQIQNVAAGVVSANSTDAINGSQLFTVGSAVNNLGAGTAAAFGGGAKVAADGTLTAPSYVIGGNTYTNVASAFDAQGKLSVQYTPDAKGNPTAVVDLASNPALPAGTKAVALNGVANATTANGAVALGQMPMQYATAGAPTTANPAVPSNNVTLVGAAAGPVVLDNVAPGSLAVGSTQAVNGGQVNTVGTSIANNFGGGAAFDPATGKVTAPAYTIGSSSYNNVGSALTALDASVNGGGGIKYFHTNSTLADATATGTDATAVGPLASASGTNAIAIGNGANANSAGGIAIGNSAAAKAIGAMAMGDGAVAAGANSVALGAGSTDGGQANVVSVGAVGAERKLINVAGGSIAVGSTEGINGGQIFANQTSVAASLGGGSKVNADGTLALPGYSIGGTAYNNVGGALTALDNSVNGGGGVKYFHTNSTLADATASGTDATAVGPLASASGTGAVAMGKGSTASATGSVALGQGASATGANSVALGAGSTDGGQANVVSVGAVGAERKIVNVAAGTVASGSTDAVNGGQIYNNQASVAAALGGGSKVNPDGTISAPSYAVGGSTYNNVGGAVTALDKAVTGLTGQVASMPIQGNNTSNLAQPSATGADATAVGFGSKATGTNSVALGSGSTDGGQANVVSVGAVGAERKIVNVAAGAVTASSTDAVNGSQLYQAQQQMASLGHKGVQYATSPTGTTLSEISLQSDAGGPVVIHNLAPGVAATDAANVAQVQAVAAVANNGVQYDKNADGTKANSVTFSGGTAGAPVTLRNIAAGVNATDAVNLSQLQSASASTLASANAYTDKKISNLQAFTEQGIKDAKNLAIAGTALALAGSGLRYDDRPGKTSVAGATSFYKGTTGMAFGLGHTSANSNWRYNLSVNGTPFAEKPEVGVVVGASFTFN